MYKSLLKYNLLTILPFQDTFFYTEKLPKKVNFTKELIRVNYLKHSSFANPNIIYKIEDKKILVWYFKENINTPVIIPESFIAYRELRKYNEDAIYIVDDEIIKVVVIKDRKLLSLFTLSELDNLTIELTMDEFQLFKRVDISTHEYQTLIQKSLKSLTFKDFYNFIQVSLDRKTVLKSAIDKFSYPLSALIIFAIFVSYIQNSILQSEIEDLKKSYQVEKEKNKKIKSFVKKHNKEVKKWKGFINKELRFIGPIAILDSIYTTFHKGEKAYIISVVLNANNLVIKVQTDMNPIIFLNRLNKIEYFSNVVIQNTYKPRNKMKITTYEITVKTLKEL